MHSIQHNFFTGEDYIERRYHATYPLTQGRVDHQGALQRKKNQKSEITMEVGGWVQVSLRIFLWKISPKPVHIFWSSIPCVFYLYTLLKVVGYYDLSVLSM